jgi:hypothetical protein
MVQIDLSQVKGTGLDGVIVRADIEEFQGKSSALRSVRGVTIVPGRLAMQCPAVFCPRFTWKLSSQ